jgi:hypothetical protein
MKAVFRIRRRFSCSLYLLRDLYLSPNNSPIVYENIGSKISHKPVSFEVSRAVAMKNDRILECYAMWL